MDEVGYGLLIVLDGVAVSEGVVVFVDVGVPVEVRVAVDVEVDVIVVVVDEVCVALGYRMLTILRIT